MTSTRRALLSADYDGLVAGLGGPGRAAAVMRALRSGLEPDEASGLVGSRTRRALEGRFRFSPPRIAELHEATDGALKLVLTLADGLSVETVLIPTRGRTTLCVSSQVGCLRGCRFCLTAQMGLTRQLSRAEILAQLWWGRRLVRERGLQPLRNVVFMGMGEPLDNWDEVRPALEQMTDTRLHGVGKKHVTLSTVAPTAAKVRAIGRAPARLAWSLHASDAATRGALVPTQQDSPAALRSAWLELLEARREALFVEVTLIAGRNDSDAQAAELAAFLEPFGDRTRVNLLPVNPGRAEVTAPAVERCEAFAGALRAAGLFTALRKPRGQGSGAACGQLVQR